jgi:acetylornithine aminotransferase
MLDEVQTGIGRTGAWFAFQGAGLRPDVITLAKGLGNGLPIGACIAREDAAFGLGEHASTFGGGPVPCAAALATLAVIEEEGLLGNAMEQGKRLRHGLREALPEGSFRDVRGRGLLVGIELAPPLTARGAVLALLERGVLATEAGPAVVRLTPPLTITGAEIDESIGHLVAAVEGASR